MSTHEARLQALERRLEDLEERNRRMRGTAVLAIVLLALVLLTGSAAPGISSGASPNDGIDARRFDLRDDEGNTRASLYVDEVRGPVLAFYGDDQGVRAAFDQENVLFVDGERNPRTMLTAGVDGPGLRMTDSDGFSAVIGRTATRSGKTGLPQTSNAASVTLFGRNNELLWSAP